MYRPVQCVKDNKAIINLGFKISSEVQKLQQCKVVNLKWVDLAVWWSCVRKCLDNLRTLKYDFFVLAPLPIMEVIRKNKQLPF